MAKSKKKTKSKKNTKVKSKAKAATKKAAPKKVIAKKAAKKATKKVVAKKAATKSAAPKKATPKKSLAKKAVTKKDTTTKLTVKTKAHKDSKPEVRDVDEIVKDKGHTPVVNPYAANDARKNKSKNAVVAADDGEEDEQMKFESVESSMDEDMNPEELYEDPSTDDEEEIEDEGDEENYF